MSIGFTPDVVSSAHFGDVARQLARDPNRFRHPVRESRRNLLLVAAAGTPSENTRTTEWILLRALVAADDVVVQHRLEIPALALCHLREMLAAVQTLLLAGDRQKNNRRAEISTCSARARIPG